jgi:hypothetical protein
MDNLLTFLYWFLGIIAFLFAVGLALVLIGSGINEREDDETNEVLHNQKRPE